MSRILEQRIQDTAHELFFADSDENVITLSTELNRLGFSYFRSPLPLGTATAAHQYSALSSPLVRDLTMKYLDHRKPAVREAFIKPLAYWGSAPETQALWDKLRHERAHPVLAAIIQSLRMIAGPTAVHALAWAYHNHVPFQNETYSALEQILKRTKNPYATLTDCPDVTRELQKLLGLP